jgi:hypothetical protein
MKIYIILLFTIIISCFSCKKDEPKTHTVEGKWLLINGEVYIENMDKGGVMYYDHFSATKPNSAMDLSGANLPIDFISQNKTTWEFEKEFKLNDSMTYEVAYERYSIRIYGLENGSARVLMIDSITDNFVRFTTGERRQNIGGTNSAYFSKLSFSKIP